MKKHTKYIIEYENVLEDGVIDDIMKAFDSIRGRKLLKGDRNANRKNYAHYLGMLKNDPYLNYTERKISQYGEYWLGRYREDCPDINYSMMSEYPILENFVYRYYKSGDHYNWHVDKSHTDIQLKISLLLFLNDDFEGGELAFMNDDLKIKPKKGSVVFFPCGPYFLHSSTPILEGNKHVVWNCYGQKATPPDKSYF